MAGRREQRDAIASEHEGIAREAERRALAADAHGPVKAGRAGKSLTPAQKQLRDTAIVLGSHAGIDPRELGKTFGITPRSVERILASFRLRRTALDSAPMEIVERSLRVYEQQMADAATVAASMIERQPAVALGAMKLHADIHERYLNLLSDIGQLPENLEVFRVEASLVRLGQTVLDQVKALVAGTITPEELYATVEEAVFAQSPLPVVEGHAIERGPQSTDS